jgi:hypothetical protein
MKGLRESTSVSVDRPDILVFPPILLGGTMLLGFGLDRRYPVPLLPLTAARLDGGALFALTGALADSTDGPYRRTRNPLYLAGLGVYLGVVCFVNGIAPFPLLAPLAALSDWGIVQREERYLGAKFGSAYRA